MGRGDGRLVRPSSNPSVTIGLTLGTSSPTLSSSSPDPFYITVTARILNAPQPSSITLQTHPSPLEDLSNRSFKNIICIDKPEKHIEIFPRGWPQYHWNPKDLRRTWTFVTIPREGSYVAHHEVRQDRILAAALQKGERYRVSLTDKCLGTRWWAFKDLDELDGVRLKAWREPTEGDVDEEFSYSEEEREMRERFGDGPSCMGEEPGMLAMVVEGVDAEFEIV